MKAELNRQSKEVGEKLNRLYEDIENGLVSLDETLKQRVSDIFRSSGMASSPN